MRKHLRIILCQKDRKRKRNSRVKRLVATWGHAFAEDGTIKKVKSLCVAKNRFET